MITSIKEFKESLPNTITCYHGGTLSGNLNTPLFLATTEEDASHYVLHADDPIITSLFKIDFITNKILTIKTKADVMFFFDLIRQAGFPIEIAEDKLGGWFVPEQYTEPIRQHSKYEGFNYNDWTYVPKVRDYLLQLGYDTIRSSDEMGFVDMPIYILLNPQQQVKSIKKIE